MNIPYRRFSFTVQANDPLLLPAYAGSTFRGAFGTVFRRMVCALRQKECSSCMLGGSCSYAYIFETAPPEGARFLNMGKYTRIPHPFIIEPPATDGRVVRPGDRLQFHLVLVGRALEYLPYFICTFDEIGKSGIGKGRGGYVLLSVSADNNAVYDRESGSVRPCRPASLELSGWSDNEAEPDMKIHMLFQTPVRIQSERRLATELPFALLVRNLLRRIGLLYHFHCGGSEPAWNVQEMIAAAGAVSVQSDKLKWHDWERYSSRQKTAMKLGGLIGDVTYAGKIRPFLPLLKAGEILHAGKGTSFGLGKYVLQEAEIYAKQ
ncbi:MAG TPA: CRISPR system precrRNA processing endoribonuclease RAMP protein Cas6 [Dissulfurispiraceae bacterium]|nr:CRISPR system precrRNA processing endoribonuclease RAMP protein Cas6 [Dissulfurispiraceae bacterium]